MKRRLIELIITIGLLVAIGIGLYTIWGMVGVTP